MSDQVRASKLAGTFLPICKEGCSAVWLIGWLRLLAVPLVVVVTVGQLTSAAVCESPSLLDPLVGRSPAATPLAYV